MKPHGFKFSANFQASWDVSRKYTSVELRKIRCRQKSMSRVQHSQIMVEVFVEILYRHESAKTV